MVVGKLLRIYLLDKDASAPLDEYAAEEGLLVGKQTAEEGFPSDDGAIQMTIVKAQAAELVPESTEEEKTYIDTSTTQADCERLTSSLQGKSKTTKRRRRRGRMATQRPDKKWRNLGNGLLGLVRLE